MENGGSRERRPGKTSDSGLKSQGEVGWGLGSRSGGEKSRARFCSQLWQTHLAFAPAYLAGPPCPGPEEAGSNERQLWPGGRLPFVLLSASKAREEVVQP